MEEDREGPPDAGFVVEGSQEGAHPPSLSGSIRDPNDAATRTAREGKDAYDISRKPAGALDDFLSRRRLARDVWSPCFRSIRLERSQIVSGARECSSRRFGV